MIRDILNSAPELGIYSTITMVLFITIFIGVVVWMVCVKKPYLKYMSELPLENNNSAEGDE